MGMVGYTTTIWNIWRPIPAQGTGDVASMWFFKEVLANEPRIVSVSTLDSKFIYKYVTTICNVQNRKLSPVGYCDIIKPSGCSTGTVGTATLIPYTTWDYSGTSTTWRCKTMKTTSTQDTQSSMSKRLNNVRARGTLAMSEILFTVIDIFY